MWEMEKKSYRVEICEILTRIGLLQFGTFTLVSGALSPYYIDLRMVPSFPRAFKKIEKIYRDIAENEVKTTNFNRIAGIPTAGIPFASVLAFSLQKPLLYVRSGPKNHGRQRMVEGVLFPGDAVLLVDDLITTGDSLLAAAANIRSEGGIVKDALVLIDREEGGKDALTKQKIRLHSLISISDAVEILFKKDVITEEQKNSIIRRGKK
jgi:orotate phosphoribosyltransferase